MILGGFNCLIGLNTIFDVLEFGQARPGGFFPQWVVRFFLVGFKNTTWFFTESLVWAIDRAALDGFTNARFCTTDLRKGLL
jgi:hypothetical protein